MDVLLRVEGVNLGKFIDDTADLSTIRGSSLVLLEVIGKIRAHLEADYDGRVVPLSLGASSGLFLIKDADLAKAKELRDTIAGRLADGAFRVVEAKKEDDEDARGLERFATFVVDIEPLRDADDFRRAQEAVLARNRWRQMQAPRLVMPKETAPSGLPVEQRVCNADHVRPGRPASERPTRKDWDAVSEAVWERRGYGIKKKKKEFYEDILKPHGHDWPFADVDLLARDMAEIAAPEGSGRLTGKVALVYADGNSFGKLQRAFVEGKPFGGRQVSPDDLTGVGHAARQRKFDGKLRRCRAALLASLLHRLALRRELSVPVEETSLEVEQGKYEKQKFVRLETQLWGGDELIWVVPATLGHEAVRLLFAATVGWRLGEVGLTHAVGVVFCHHDAPIARIRKLADGLAGLCKRVGRGEPAGRDLVAYEVLESFDHIGRDLDAYRKERCPPGVPPEAWLLRPCDWAALGKVTRVLKPIIPRRQLVRLADTLQREGVGGSFATDEKRLFGEHPKVEKRTAGLRARLGAMAWVHLEELWDYIGEPTEVETPRDEAAP